MTIPQITIIYSTRIVPEFKFEKSGKVFELKLPSDCYKYKVLGFDPGTTRLGIAYITHYYCVAYELEWERGNTTNQRIWQLNQQLEDFKYLHPFKIIVEGASYADKYRQVELQDIRAGIVCWDMEATEVVPPNTIRKVVFGSAKIKNPWTEQGIPDNAAAALACSLYPIMLEKGKENG